MTQSLDQRSKSQLLFIFGVPFINPLPTPYTYCQHISQYPLKWKRERKGGKNGGWSLPGANWEFGRSKLPVCSGQSKSLVGGGFGGYFSSFVV